MTIASDHYSVKRREPLPLSHVLAHVFEDSRPSTIPLPRPRSPEPPGVPRIDERSESRGGAPADAATAAGGRAPRGIEQRIHTRFDKAFLVMIGSELYGDSVAVARNVSAGGILVEMSYAPPLGTVVTVHFQHLRDDDQLDEIVARAEVKHHHYLNFSGPGAGPEPDAASTRAIGLRFLEFIAANERIAPDRLH